MLESPNIENSDTTDFNEPEITSDNFQFKNSFPFDFTSETRLRQTHMYLFLIATQNSSTPCNLKLSNFCGRII